jgi:ABC-type Mn2+/Zn2+ transport system ATPase subunit
MKTMRALATLRHDDSRLLLIHFEINKYAKKMKETILLRTLTVCCHVSMRVAFCWAAALKANCHQALAAAPGAGLHVGRYP